jgi:hypothetical protein
MRPDADAETHRAAELTPAVEPSASWRLAALDVLPGFRLRVNFNDGTEGTVETARFLGSPEAGVFAALRDETLFRRARLETGAVTRPGNLDSAPDAMYAQSRNAALGFCESEGAPAAMTWTP